MMAPIKIRDEAHLRELHKEYFTASRVAALYGEGRTTRFQEFHVLRGTLDLPDIDSDILRRGRMLQRVARPLLLDERSDWDVRDTTLFFPHQRIARFGAAPDLILRAPHQKGQGAGEVKVVAAPIYYEQWAEGPPLAVELQNQSQIACGAFAWGAIIAIVIGSFSFDVNVFERERRGKTIERVESDIEAFLADVEAGTEPPIDFSQDTTALARLYQQSNGKTVDLSSNNQLPELCEDYLRAAHRESAASAYKEICKGEILSIIKDNEIVLTRDHKLSTSTVPGAKIEYERKPYRNFKVTKRKEKKETTGND